MSRPSSPASWGEARAADALELLRHADEAVRKILYIEDFARQKLFFSGACAFLPLVHVFWDCIFFNDASRHMLQHLVRDPEEALRGGEAAFGNFPRMLELAAHLDWPVEDIEFMRDTFAMLMLARRYYFEPVDPALEGTIIAAKEAYKLRWPRPQRQRYRLRTSFAPLPVKVRTLRWVLALVLRRQRGYRPVARPPVHAARAVVDLPVVPDPARESPAQAGAQDGNGC